MKSYIDRENLLTSIEKIELFKRESEIALNSMISSMDALNHIYITENTLKLYEVEEEIKSATKQISNNSNHYVLLLGKAVNTYEDALVESEEILDTN